MTDQVSAIVGVLRSPRETFRRLPSERIWALAILSPLYFGVAKAFRPRQHEVLVGWFGGTVQAVLFTAALSLLMLPVGGWLMKHFLHLFKKRLTVKKILNINGYAYVPRLIVALIGNLLILAKPDLLSGESMSATAVVIIGLGVAGLIYTIFLLVYGIVVTESDDNKLPNQAL